MMMNDGRIDVAISWLMSENRLVRLIPRTFRFNHEVGLSWRLPMLPTTSTPSIYCLLRPFGVQTTTRAVVQAGGEGRKEGQFPE
jgi:hypothetical protein